MLISISTTANPLFFLLWIYLLTEFTMKKSKENRGEWLPEITEANSNNRGSTSGMIIVKSDKQQHIYTKSEHKYFGNITSRF